MSDTTILQNNTHVIKPKKSVALSGVPAGNTALCTVGSALGCTLPEKEGHTVSGARDIADKLLASLSSILLYWYHYSHNGERIQPETDDDSIGGHFLHLLHGEKPTQSWEKAMHISLVLYAEHEFNASTFTSRVIAGTGSDVYSAIIGVRNTAGRMRSRWRFSSATKRRTKPKPISVSAWKTKKW